MDKQKKKVTIVGSVVAAILIILLVFVSARQQNLFGRGAEQGATENDADCGDGLSIATVENSCDNGKQCADKITSCTNNEECASQSGDDKSCLPRSDDGCSSTCTIEPGWECGDKGCSWNKQHFEDKLKESFEAYESLPAAQKTAQAKSQTIAASQDSIKKYLQNR